MLLGETCAKTGAVVYRFGTTVKAQQHKGQYNTTAQDMEA